MHISTDILSPVPDISSYFLRIASSYRYEAGPAVTFMLERIRKETGVNVSPSEHILCLPCDKSRSGGFTPELGAVLLCQGNFWSKKHMEHTLTHELVHMYDHCKFNVDWTNLRHQACAEVTSRRYAAPTSAHLVDIDPRKQSKWQLLVVAREGRTPVLIHETAPGVLGGVHWPRTSLTPFILRRACGDGPSCLFAGTRHVQTRPPRSELSMKSGRVVSATLGPLMRCVRRCGVLLQVV